jgi:transketolase
MSNFLDNHELRQLALEYRRRVVQLALVQEFGVHLGGSLSLAEIFTVLYFAIARLDPQNPHWEDRDRIILSKGHGNTGLLTILSMRGYFGSQVFESFNQVGSYYGMHADAHNPGVEHSAGSLGHGLSVSVGMALSARLDGRTWQVYCILGDGESMEGSVWEAMMSASQYRLNNLTAIIDRNHLSQEGRTEESMRLEPLWEKCNAFGWQAFEVDGHDIDALLDAFRAERDGRPKVIIARTCKARGVPAYENQIKSHFAHLTPEQAAEALEIIHSEEVALQGGQRDE